MTGANVILSALAKPGWGELCGLLNITSDGVLPTMFPGCPPAIAPCLLTKRGSLRCGKGSFYQMPPHIPAPPQKNLRGRELVYLRPVPLDRGGFQRLSSNQGAC